VAGPALGDASGYGAAQYYETLRWADVNGDRKSDVCVRHSGGVSCWRSTGNGFDAGFAGPALSDAGGFSARQYYETLQLADINGDGKADVCVRAAAGVYCWRSNGSGFDGGFAGPAFSDANGYGAPQYYRTLKFTDVDGDRKADVCVRHGSGVTCSLATGWGFSSVVVGPALDDASSWLSPRYFGSIEFADVDGDGRKEVLARGRGGVGVYRLNSPDPAGYNVASGAM
jgi:hypothetical protein